MIKIVPISDPFLYPDVDLDTFYVITVPGLRFISELKNDISAMLETSDGLIIREMVGTEGYGKGLTRLYFSDESLAIYYKLCSESL